VLGARTGDINGIKEFEGKLIRITVPRNEMKIISVGPIRPNQVENLLSGGRFCPAALRLGKIWLRFILRKFGESYFRREVRMVCHIKTMEKDIF